MIIQKDFKKIFVFGVILFLLFGNVPFVSSEEKVSYGSNILNEFNSFSDNEVFSLLIEGIEVQEYGDVLAIYFITEGVWPDSLDIFYDIVPFSESQQETFIKINKSSEEIFEADFSVKNGSSYIFGNNEFYVPGGSRVKFYDGNIKLEVSDGAKFDRLPSFLDSKNFNSLEVEGKDITLSDGLYIRDGKVNFGLNGYEIANGDVIYDGKLFKVTKDKVLIANRDLGNYDGNWVYQDSNSLNLHSSAKGTINMQVLNDEFFNIESGETLGIQVNDGDYLEINKGVLGDYPELIHHSSEEGSTFITNGDLGTFVYTKDDLIIDKQKLGFIEDNFYGVSSYEGVGMKISSDAENVNLDVLVSDNGEVSFLKGDYVVESFNKEVSSRLEGFSNAELDRLYGEDASTIIKEDIAYLMEEIDLSYEQANRLVKEYAGFPGREWRKNTLVASFSYLEEEGFSKESSFKLISEIVKNEGENFHYTLNYLLPDSIKLAKQSGLSHEESANLISSLIKNSGQYSSEILRSVLPSAIEVGLTPEGAVNLISTIMEENSDFIYNSIEHTVPSFLEKIQKENITIDYGLFIEAISEQSKKGQFDLAIGRGLDKTVEFGKFEGFSAQEVYDIILKDRDSLSNSEIEIKDYFLNYADPYSKESNLVKNIYPSPGHYPSNYDNLKDEITYKYGVTPMNSLPYLGKYLELQKDVLSASKEIGVDPYLLYNSFQQEGMIGKLQYESYSSNMKINTFEDVGIDSLIDELDSLQTLGILEEFNYLPETCEKRTNEKGNQFTICDTTADEALKGMAALLKKRKNDFESDLSSFGINKNSLSQEETNWWIYAYYNLGSTKAKNYLKKYGVQWMYDKSGEDLEKNIESVHFNAGRVAGTSELLRSYNIFN